MNHHSNTVTQIHSNTRYLGNLIFFSEIPVLTLWRSLFTELLRRFSLRLCTHVPTQQMVSCEERVKVGERRRD